MPSGMPVLWARHLAADPDFVGLLAIQMVQNSPESVAAGIRDDPAQLIRDAGLDPAGFDVEGSRTSAEPPQGSPTQ
jgi:hypothetical protein